MKKKSVLSLFLATLATFSVFASGCQGFHFGGTQSSSESSEVVESGESSESSVETHTHTISRDWEMDEEYHWHTAVCGCEDVVVGKEEHTWGDWYEVVPVECVSDGEEERMCEVCGQFETRTVEQPGHISDGSSYFNRYYHWEMCEECMAIMNKTEHAKTDGDCTTCEWEDTEYLYWNDSDTVDTLKMGFSIYSQNIDRYCVYKEELPAGYVGDCRMFFKLEVNRLGVSWSNFVLPELDKAVYEQLRGKGVQLTSKVYCEYPEAINYRTEISFLSYYFSNETPDNFELDDYSQYYEEEVYSGEWTTIDFWLDELLDNWQYIEDYRTLHWEEVSRTQGMFFATYGDAISLDSRYDMYWGDFQLVWPNGERVLLSEVNLDV